MKVLVYVFILIVTALTFSKSLQAAPVITSVTGTIKTGSSVDIFGTGFGTSTQMPLLHANLESGVLQPDTLGFNSTFHDNGDGSPGNTYVISTATDTSGTVFVASATTTSTLISFRLSANWTPGFYKIYSFVRRKFNFDFQVPNNEVLNDKNWRLWPNENTTATNSDDFTMGWSSNTFASETESDPINVRNFQGSKHPVAQWFNEEIIWQKGGGTGYSWDGQLRICDGSGGNPTGDCTRIFKYLRDGQVVVNMENAYNDVSGDAMRLDDIGELVMPGPGSSQPPPVGSTSFMRYIFISSDDAHVMFSTASTWATALACAWPQPQSQWNNDGTHVRISSVMVSDLPGVTNGIPNAGTNIYGYMVTHGTGTIGAVNTTGFLLSAGLATYPALCPNR